MPRLTDKYLEKIANDLLSKIGERLEKLMPENTSEYFDLSMEFFYQDEDVMTRVSLEYEEGKEVSATLCLYHFSGDDITSEFVNRLVSRYRLMESISGGQNAAFNR